MARLLDVTGAEMGAYQITKHFDSERPSAR